MLSTRVRTLPGRTAAHAWQTAVFSSATVEAGHPCLGSRLTSDPKHAQLGSCLDCELASPWPQHPVGPETATVSRAVWGGALSWTYTKLCPNIPVAHGNIWFLRIWIYRCQFMAPSTTTSSLLPSWWIVPHTMTDGPRFPLLGWTQASISLSPCLRRTRTRPSLWYRENRDSSLKIQCLHCLRSHTWCPPLSVASPVLQSEPRTSGWTPRPISGGQKPSANGSNWHPPPKSADHLHSQTRCRDEVVHSDHSSQLTVFPWRGDFHRTPTLPLMWSASLSVASQNFAYASLRHPQYPGYFLLRIAICRQPNNSLQYLL